jgi:hypothetical protein
LAALSGRRDAEWKTHLRVIGTLVLLTLATVGFVCLANAL